MRHLVVLIVLASPVFVQAQDTEPLAETQTATEAVHNNSEHSQGEETTQEEKPPLQWLTDRHRSGTRLLWGHHGIPIQQRMLFPRLALRSKMSDEASLAAKKLKSEKELKGIKRRLYYEKELLRKDLEILNLRLKYEEGENERLLQEKGRIQDKLLLLVRVASDEFIIE